MSAGKVGHFLANISANELSIFGNLAIKQLSALLSLSGGIVLLTIQYLQIVSYKKFFTASTESPLTRLKGKYLVDNCRLLPI